MPNTRTGPGTIHKKFSGSLSMIGISKDVQRHRETFRGGLPRMPPSKNREIQPAWLARLTRLTTSQGSPAKTADKSFSNSFSSAFPGSNSILITAIRHTKCADACIMSRPLRVHQTLHRPGNTCKLDQKYQNCILYPSGINLIFPGLIRSCTFQLQCMVTEDVHQHWNIQQLQLGHLWLPVQGMTMVTWDLGQEPWPTPRLCINGCSSGENKWKWRPL